MEVAMEIELVWPEGRVVPVPLKEDYHLHTHLFGFLVTRYYYPRDIRPNMTPVTGGSLRQIAYRPQGISRGACTQRRRIYGSGIL